MVSSTYQINIILLIFYLEKQVRKSSVSRSMSSTMIPHSTSASSTSSSSDESKGKDELFQSVKFSSDITQNKSGHNIGHILQKEPFPKKPQQKRRGKGCPQISKMIPEMG